MTADEIRAHQVASLDAAIGDGPGSVEAFKIFQTRQLVTAAFEVAAQLAELNKLLSVATYTRE